MSLFSFVGGISNVVAPPPTTNDEAYDIDSLRYQLQARESQIEQLTAALGSLSDELTNVKLAHAEEMSTMGHYQLQAELYAKELRTKEEEVRRLQAGAAELHETNGGPVKAPNQDILLQTLQQRENQVMQLMEEGAALRHQIEEDEERHMASIQSITAETQRLQIALQTLQADLDTARQFAAQETERAEILQQEMTAHMDVMAVKADADGQLRKELTALQAKVEQLEDQLSQERSYNAMLMEERAEWQAADVPALQQQCSALQLEGQRLLQELETAQAEANAHLQVLSAKKEEEANLKQRLQELEMALEQEQHSVAQWSASCRQLEQENEGHLDLLTVKQQSEGALRRQVEELATQLTAARSCMEDNEGEMTRLKAAMGTAESAQQLQEQVWHLQQQETKLQAIIAERNATLEQVERDFDKCQNMFASRDSECRELKVSIQKLHDELRTAKTETESHLRALAAKSEGESVLRDELQRLQQQCEQLQDSLAQQTSFSEAMQMECAAMEDLKAKVDQLQGVEEDRYHLQQQMEVQAGRIRQLEDEMASHLASLAAHTEGEATLRQEIDVYRQEAERWAGQCRALEQRCTQLEEENEGHMSVLNAKREAEAETRQQFRELQQQLTDTQKAFKELSADYARLEEQLSIGSQGEAELQSQVLSLNRQVAELGEALAKEQEKGQQMFAERETYDAKLLEAQGLHETLSRLRAQVAEMQPRASIAETLEVEVTELRRSLTASKEEIQELIGRYEELQQECDGHVEVLQAKMEGESQLKRELLEWRQKAESLAEQVQQQNLFVESVQADQADLEALRAELQSLRTSQQYGQALQQQLETTKQELGHRLQELAAQADANEALQEELSSLRGEHNQLTQRCRALEEEVEGHLQVLAAKHEADADARQQSAALEKQLRAAQQEAQDQREQVKMLKTQLGSNNSSDAAMQQQIHELTKEVADLRRNLQQLQSENSTLHEERTTIEAKLVAQQQELHNAHEKNMRTQTAQQEASERLLEEQRAELETLRATIVLAHEACQSLAQDKGLLEEEIEGHLQVLEAKQQSENQLRQQLEGIIAQYQELEAALQNQKANFGVTKQEVQQLTVERDRYRVMWEQREEELAYCKAQMMTGDAERVELLAARADLQFQLQDARQQLSTQSAVDGETDGGHVDRVDRPQEVDRLREEVRMMSHALAAKQEQEHILKEELRHSIAKAEGLTKHVEQLESQLRSLQKGITSPVHQGDNKFPDQDPHSLVHPAVEDYGPQQTYDAENGWQSPTAIVSPDTVPGAWRANGSQASVAGASNQSDPQLSAFKENFPNLCRQLGEVEDVLAQKTQKVNALRECLVNIEEVLLGSRQCAEQLMAQLYENNILLQQKERAFNLVGEMEKYRSHALKRAQHFAHKGEKKNAELLHLEMTDLRRDTVRLSTLLEEMGTLLWAASQQLERPWDAAQKVIDAVGIATHTVEEGKLHSEVLTMLVALAQKSTGTLQDTLQKVQKGDAGEAVGLSEPTSASKAVVDTLVEFPLPPPPPPFTPPPDIMTTPRTPATGPATVPISKFIERPVNLERLAPKRAKLQQEVVMAPTNEMEWIAGELYNMAAGAVKFFGWG